MSIWKPTRRSIVRGMLASPAIISNLQAGTLTMLGAGPGAALSGGGGLGLQTSCTAFWQFDNTSWLDSSGNGSTLTPSATPPTLTPGPGLSNSSALFVSALSESLSVANNSFLAVGGGNFSIQCWVKATSAVGSWFTKDNGGFGQREWSFQKNFTSSNVYAFGIYPAGNSVSFLNSTVTIDTNWHHLISTWDGTTLKLYIDAGTPATGTPAASLNSTSGVIIGGSGNGVGFGNAAVTFCAIWKGRVLTAGNVTTLFNSGAGLNWSSML